MADEDDDWDDEDDEPQGPNLHILNTVEKRDKFWDECEPILAEGCRKNNIGEASVSDVRQAIQNGGGVLFVVTENYASDVRLVFFATFQHQADGTVLHISFLSGKRLRDSMNMFWKDICGWAKVNGATRIEALVGTGMDRMLEPYGFEYKQTLLKQDLSWHH